MNKCSIDADTKFKCKEIKRMLSQLEIKEIFHHSFLSPRKKHFFFVLNEKCYERVITDQRQKFSMTSNKT